MRTKILFSIFLFAFFFLITTAQCFAADPIQTQMGPDDTEVDLIQVKTNGKVLSLALKVKNPNDSYANTFFDPNEIYYIDADQNKKYHILKDEKGKWLAGPLQKMVSPKNTYQVGKRQLGENKSIILWMKFPAPLGENPKIELNLPGVVPFSDIEIAQ